MRTFIFVLVVVLGVIWICGGVPIGGNTIFGRIDSMLGTTVLTDLHRTVFFLFYRGEQTAESGLMKTGQEVEGFQQRPAGIDNKSKYRQLDEAAKD